VVIFGWGRRTFHHAGPVLYQWCRNCSNSNWFYLVTVRRWLTLFFIPVIPYQRQHMLICPVCNRGLNLAGAELQWAKSLNQLAVLYTTNAISGDEYMRRLRESGAPSPAVAAAPPPVLAPVGAPVSEVLSGVQVAAPPPLLAQGGTSGSDGFGGIQIAGPPPVGAPPMPTTTPPFRGTPMGRRAQVMRVLMPIAAIALVAGIWIYTNQNDNNSNVPQGSIATTFVAGTCIDGTPTSSEITFASCTGDYDGKIVEVLNASETVCAFGDTLFVATPPNPNLCINFNDHNP
jgi:hypothetical protein